MSKRIRYTKTSEDGVLTSIRNLVSESTNAQYNVLLDTNRCTFTIKNINSGRSYSGGENVNNLHVLKRKVKQKLASLGVSFTKEIRDNSNRVVGVNCSYKKAD